MSVLLVERDAGGSGVITLTLNRPDKLNALNEELLRALDDAMRALGSDPSVRAAVLTGAGEKAFAAGADIAAMATMGVEAGRAFSALGHRAMGAMEKVHFPIIGAVHGFALGGGCELALACDFLYASDRAKFGQPEVNLGVIPGFGGTQRLARRIGIGRAREMCFTGAMIGAEEALRIGLVNAVVPAAELLPKAHATAHAIAKKGPLAVAHAKRLVANGEGLPLATANELETLAFGALFGSQDQKEGMAAFLAKREPAFLGQ